VAWAVIADLLEDLGSVLGSAGAGAALGGLLSGLGSALTGALGTIGTVLSRVVGIIRRIATVIGNALRRIVNFFERIARIGFWQHVVSLVRSLSNPRTAVTVIVGTAVTLISLTEIGMLLRTHKEEIETQLEELHRNVIQVLNNLKLQYEADIVSTWATLYNTVMSAVPGLWGITLGAVIATISCLTNINIGWKFIIVTLLNIFIPILDMFLGVLARVVPYLIDVFGYVAELSAKYGLWLIFFILIPIAVGLTVVRMYTTGLSTFPYSIGQPVEVSDRGFGWVMFNILYPMALMHPSVKQVLEQAKQYYVKPIVPPTVPPPPKPTVSQLLAKMYEYETAILNICRGIMEYVTLRLEESESLNISIHKTGVPGVIPGVQNVLSVNINEKTSVSIGIYTPAMKPEEVYTSFTTKESVVVNCYVHVNSSLATAYVYIGEVYSIYATNVATAYMYIGKVVYKGSS